MYYTIFENVLISTLTSEIYLNTLCLYKDNTNNYGK